MPLKKFQCQVCGLSLRRRTSKETHSVTCDCGEKAVAEGSSLSVGFVSTVNKTMKTQETGIESFDLDFDRVIGEDARQKWETIYQRRRDKWDIINRNNVTGKEIVRMEDGSYDSIPEVSSKMRTSRISAMDNIKAQNNIETKEK
jgi:hypothetical protein